MLGHSRRDNYVKTKQTGQLHQDTVDDQLHQDILDGTITLGHSRWDNFIRTQQTGQLSNNRVYEKVMLGQNRQYTYFRSQQRRK